MPRHFEMREAYAKATQLEEVKGRVIYATVQRIEKRKRVRKGGK